MRYLIVGLIRIYQKTLSPDHGWFKNLYPHGYCKFHPSCSEYCAQSYLKYGMLKGTTMCTWRILRCNPWSQGGHDPII